MSDSNSTAPAPSGKPAKPYDDFPLFPHASGQWAKKIKGRMFYFGKWHDPDAALDSYLRQKDALHAGRKPREQAEGTTVKELANAFLQAKQALVDSGDLLARTWTDYKAACDLIVSRFSKSRLVEDLGPDDFAALRQYMTKQWAATSVRSVIQRVRCVFKFASDNRLIPEPVCFGQNFKRPSNKALRLLKHRQGQAPKLFTGEEIHQLLGAASAPVKAQLLLGINCGFGNTDCGTLPLAAIDWDKAIIDYPRPKTGMPRRCPLWPETMAALREALAVRPAPKDPAHSGLVFITQRGLPWAKEIADSPLTKEVAKLLKALSINGSRNFYALRHTFRTVADEAKDQPAADYIMGHEVAHMSSVYRETISDERLRAVADHVRKWLFPSAAKIESVE
ncbi:MAG TPA: site-specific integrase [Gemmataceae bacterium]|jgi:integrase